MELKSLAALAQDILDQISQQSQGEVAKYHFSCPPGCGSCCLSPTVEASASEFLPLAFFWWQSMQLEYYLEKLQSALQGTDSTCLLFVPGQRGGNCGFYPYRGLICRAFGLSKMVDKYGKQRWSICRQLSHLPTPPSAEQSPLPTLSQWRWQFESNFPRELTRLLPINQAIYQSCVRVQQMVEFTEESNSTHSAGGRDLGVGQSPT